MRSTAAMFGVTMVNLDGLADRDTFHPRSFRLLSDNPLLRRIAGLQEMELPTDNDALATSLAMLQSALVLLDEIGEADAAIKVQHAISILCRESIPKTLAEAEAALARLHLNQPNQG